MTAKALIPYKYTVHALRRKAATSEGETKSPREAGFLALLEDPGYLVVVGAGPPAEGLPFGVALFGFSVRCVAEYLS